MYTLRTIRTNYPIANQCLGDHYHTILKESTPEEFKKTCEIYWNEPEPEQTYGFIVCFNGSKVLPLFAGNFYYIMTENGKTFDNLSQK